MRYVCGGYATYLSMRTVSCDLHFLFYRYVKPEKERGPDSSVCYGYGFHDDKVSPDLCHVGDWCCFGEKSFIQENSIRCSLYDASMKQKGAIVISGAGGDCTGATHLNGTFELSLATCNGMPGYVKVGEPDTCVEMCKTPAGTWQWCVKPLADLGSQVDIGSDYGYGVASDVLFPHECAVKKWHYNNGTEFEINESIVVELLPGVTMPEFALVLQDIRQREWLGKCSAKIEEVDLRFEQTVLYFTVFFTVFLKLFVNTIERLCSSELTYCLRLILSIVVYA